MSDLEAIKGRMSEWNSGVFYPTIEEDLIGTDLPALVAEVERLRSGPCFCAFCGQAYASGKSEADLQAIQEHVRGCRSHPLNQEILTLDSRLTEIRVERDALRARVKELEEKLDEMTLAFDSLVLRGPTDG